MGEVKQGSKVFLGVSYRTDSSAPVPLSEMAVAVFIFINQNRMSRKIPHGTGMIKKGLTTYCL